MSLQSTEVLKHLLKNNGLDWVMDIFGRNDRFLPNCIKQLDRITDAYRARGFDVAVSFTPESLETAAAKNSLKVRAFLQAFCVASSPEMLVMVWRILEGLRIQEIKMLYLGGHTFELTVALGPAGARQLSPLPWHAGRRQRGASAASHPVPCPSRE